MEDGKMDAIDRALLFLAKAIYANHGAGVVARVIPADSDSQGT